MSNKKTSAVVGLGVWIAVLGAIATAETSYKLRLVIVLIQVAFCFLVGYYLSDTFGKKR